MQNPDKKFQTLQPKTKEKKNGSLYSESPAFRITLLGFCSNLRFNKNKTPKSIFFERQKRDSEKRVLKRDWGNRNQTIRLSNTLLFLSMITQFGGLTFVFWLSCIPMVTCPPYITFNPMGFSLLSPLLFSL